MATERISPQRPHNDEHTVVELLQVFWRGKWFMFMATTAVLLVAAVMVFFLPKRYQASVLMIPASSESAGALGAIGGLANQIGGLGSLIGLGKVAGDRTQEFLAILQSRRLTEQFIEQHRLLPILFADRWDAGNQTWKNGTDAPSMWDAIRVFDKKIRSVSESKLTGLVTLNISWRDPALAAQWANELVARANELTRIKALEDSERNIAYLTEQANATNEVGLRTTIYTLLETEFKQVMLARGNQEYAFRVIDPAVAPEKPSFPRPLLMLIGALGFGILSSAIFLVLQSFFVSGNKGAGEERPPT